MSDPTAGPAPDPATDVVPLTLVPPPRSTGNLQTDFPLIVDWMYRAYLVIASAINFINTSNPDLVALQAEADQTKADAATLKSRLDGQISGTVTISNPNNVETITFTTPQPDANYRVEVQAVSSTGSAALGSFVIIAKTYTATNFSFTLGAAAGSGATVTFDWQLIRNT